MLEPLILLAVSASIFLQATCSGPSYAHTSSSSSSYSSYSQSSAVSTRREIRSHRTSPPRCTTTKRGRPCKTCGKDEIYEECLFAVCVPKTCDDVGYPVPCPDLLPNATCPDGPGCICREGYVRSKSGNCIPMSDCSSCGGDENAVSGCSSNNCNRLCSNYYKPPQACAQGCVYNSCECKKGYVYDEIKRKCVHPRKCSKLECTEPNQVYDPCPAPCPLRTCGVDDATLDCIPALSPGDPDCAPPACRCRDGFYKNDVGQCVTLEECPVCTGENEIYDPCRAPCPPQRCDVDITLILCLVPPQVGDPDCDPGCRCIDGYVRNYTGRCIPREDCPTCPPNQVFDTCIAPCPPRRCDVDDSLIRCAAPPEPGSPDCVEGCRCIDGYAKDSNEVCIPRDQCPKCTKPHEVYDPCPPLTCPPPTCENVNKKYNCPNIPVTTEDGSDEQIIQTCEGQCVCEEGYFRNLIGECIAKEDCLKCTGPHEYFSCGPACDNVCALLYKQNQTNCPIVNVKCNPMCYCQEGYARDENKICIPIEDSPICKKNEVFDPCPACKPLNCSQIGLGPLCESFPEGDCPVEPACVCKENYVRDDRTGVCIPITKCPSCGGDRNATAGCGVNCNKRCRDVGQEPGFCILICNENDCDCKEGYYLDENTDQCVLPGDCSPVCPINEIYSTCTQAECKPKNCSQLGFPVACVKIDPRFCKKGCVCKNDYVRDDNGVCIPKTDCPSCGGDLNAIAGCGGYCNQKCSNIGQTEPEACIRICNVNACDCREGYFYDEVQGRCVLPEDCAPQCPENEYYNTCTNGDCSVQNCTQIGFPISCARIDPQFCIKGCLCKEGYARNKKGVCIPIQQCPLKCKKNEVFNPCPACKPLNCSQIGLGPLCESFPEGDCPVEPACVCKENYVRDDRTGVCIPITKCPSCGGDRNATAGCGVNCNKRCRDVGQEPGFCILICNENECDCKEGYYLDENTDQCVLPGDCSPVCPINEIYSTCTQAECRPKNCSQLGFPVACPRIVPKFCKKGCVCKNDYVRDENGVCIPKTDCPSCGGDPNAIAGCGGYCNQKCNNIGQTEPEACILICNVNACDCREGYFYDEVQGRCVLQEDCSPQCPENEYYNTCTNGDCSVQNCTQVGFPISCARIDPQFCIKGCLCREGYARNKKGVCIPIQNCPKCKGDPNRKPGCGVYCNQRCSDIGKEPSGCIEICYDNSCDCKEGYYLDENRDKCVLPENCTPVCNKNEVYSECVNGGCDARNCSQLGQPIPCVKLDPRSCIKGCVCKNGYLRDTNGVCVPQSECNPQCLRSNEEYNPCPFDCPPNTCESLGRAYVCPIPNSGERVCNGRCVCKQGFYRNKIGDCISEADCLRCTGPNEFFSCGGACDNVCATLSEQNQTICPIINIQCNRMCYCEENFARARNNTCIPIDRCREPQCGVNERLETCPQKLRGPFCCSQLGYPVKDNSNKPCGKSACVCVDGYVRNNKKVCIPKEECPSCGADENAVTGCGVNCGKRCEDLVKENSVCNKICKKNACDCRDGYYYDKFQKKCVLPEQCTSICGENEQYENCNNQNSICRAKTCAEVGFPLNCTEIECKKGCSCIDNYVRDANGKCIPVRECPSCGGDKNAVSGCGVNCGKLCRDAKNPGRTGLCPLFCKLNACDCRDGFFFDQNIEMCVPAEECSPICGENEEYDFCTNGGCDFKNCSQLGGPQICRDPIECIKGCKCKKDYLRLNNGTCVPVETCPEAICRKNERFVKCPLSLCEPLSCDEVGFPISCSDIDPDSYCPGGPGCVCRENYVRNAYGKCIPKENCPSCGGDVHARAGCGVNCGTHCDNVFNISRPCPRICYPNDCDCVKGYFYDEVQDLCVPANKCSPPCNENEVRDFCVNGYCGIRNCSQIDGPILCVDPIECEIGCTCKKGYLRLDSTYECVPENECPRSNGNSIGNIPRDECEGNPEDCSPSTDEPSSPVNATIALANFQKGNDDLTTDFLWQLVSRRPGESFMFSAFSVLIALAQLALYAIGVTFKQLMALLHLKSKDEIRTIFPILIESYRSQNSVIFELANKYYSNINVPLSQKFQQEGLAVFDSQGESLDFSKNEEAAETINEWVANRTNNLITDLVNADMFSENTRLVLVNALYFLGDWVYQFNPNDTMPRNFYVGEEDTDFVSIPTMYQQGRFRYSENEEFDCQILQLPYKGENFTIDFYLPNKRTGLAEMVNKIRNSDNFANSRNKLRYETVRMYIPRMGFSTDLSDLTDLLKQANLTAPFEPDSDELKCIFEDDNQSVFLSDSIQKTYVNITETGTEAAVATAIVITSRSSLPTSVRTFEANHPFVFIIRFLETIVFAGVFRN